MKSSKEITHNQYFHHALWSIYIKLRGLPSRGLIKLGVLIYMGYLPTHSPPTYLLATYLSMNYSPRIGVVENLKGGPHRAILRVI